MTAQQIKRLRQAIQAFVTEGQAHITHAMQLERELHMLEGALSGEPEQVQIDLDARDKEEIVLTREEE